MACGGPRDKQGVDEMATIRRSGLILVLLAALAVTSTAVAFAGPQDDDEATTTTLLAEGPEEAPDPPEVLGPDSPQLPETGAGETLLILGAGIVLIGGGVTSTVIARRRLRDDQS